MTSRREHRLYRWEAPPMVNSRRSWSIEVSDTGISSLLAGTDGEKRETIGLGDVRHVVLRTGSPMCGESDRLVILEVFYEDREQDNMPEVSSFPVNSEVNLEEMISFLGEFGISIEDCRDEVEAGSSLM